MTTRLPTPFITSSEKRVQCSPDNMTPDNMTITLYDIFLVDKKDNLIVKIIG